MKEKNLRKSNRFVERFIYHGTVHAGPEALGAGVLDVPLPDGGTLLREAQVPEALVLPLPGDDAFHPAGARSICQVLADVHA